MNAFARATLTRMYSSALNRARWKQIMAYEPELAEHWGGVVAELESRLAALEGKER
jgi:hypothetical protein